MTEPDDAPATGTPKWVKVLLVASLAVNFIFIGTAGGFLLRGSDRASASRDNAILLARAMPPRDRRELLREYRKRRGEISADFPENRTQRNSIISMLEQTPFDSDALLELLGQQRTRGLRIATAGHETVVARLAEMSDSERMQVARNLRKIRNRKARARTP